MSRSRAIDTRLEKLVPSVEEYIVTGVYTRAEVKNIIRQRTDSEYRLVAKPLLLLDVRQAIQFEKGIEQKIIEYCGRSKVTLKHRWTVQERIEQIYKIGLKHLKDHHEVDALRKEYVAFLKSFRRSASLSKHYAELVVKHPLNAMYWVEAALWQSEMGEIDNARTSVQHAIALMPRSEDVYVCALSIELQFTSKLLTTVSKEHRERHEAAQAQKGAEPGDVVAHLQSENAALASVALDLALCRIVVDDAIASDGAATPSLVKRLYELVIQFPFGKELGHHVLVSAITKRQLPAMRSDVVGAGSVGKADHWQLRWLVPGTSILPLLAEHDVRCSDRRQATVSAAEFLRESTSEHHKKRRFTTEVKHSLQQSVGTCIALLYSASWESFVVSGSARLQTLIAEPLQNELVALLTKTMRPLHGPKSAAAEDPVDVPVLSAAVQTAVARQAIGFAYKPTPTTLHDCLAAVAEALGLKHAEATTREWLEHACAAARQLETADDVHSAEACCKKAAWPLHIAIRLLPTLELEALGAMAHGATTSAAAAVSLQLHAEQFHKDMNVLLMRLAALKDSDSDADVGPALFAFLHEWKMVSAEAATSQQVTEREPLFITKALPMAMWKLWFVAEAAKATTPSTICQTRRPDGNATSDDDGEDPVEATTPQWKRRRTETSGGAAAFYSSLGALGVALACRRVFAQLDAADALQRCMGITRLSYLTMQHLIGVDEVSRDKIVARLSTVEPREREAIVAGCTAFLDFLSTCTPLPRQIHSSLDIPLKEALVVCAGSTDVGRKAAAIRDARNAYERVVAHYRLARVANDDRSPLTNVVFTLGSALPPTVDKEPVYVPSSELNCQDWLAYVRFERNVVGDLRTSHNLAVRAKNECLDSKRMLILLCA